MKLRIATWNINSLRLRLPLLKELIAALEPDVICLQETKVPGRALPGRGAAPLGFPHVLFRGMKGYNGVAILSRLPIVLHDIAPDWCGKGDCRHIGVLLDTTGGPVELHNFYVPAGGDIPDRDAERRNSATSSTSSPRRATGSPRAADWRAASSSATSTSRRWSTTSGATSSCSSVVSHTPPETEGLTAWQNTGFVDAVRHFVPADQKLYTWWSYRNRDWRASDRGRRLDHVWVTPDLARQAEAADRAQGRARLAAGVGPRAGMRRAARVMVAIDNDLAGDGRG